MLKSYTNFYKNTIPNNGGPQIPNKKNELDKFNIKVANGVQATLKSADATGHTYTPEDRELMIWYNYHFLGRGKPTTHILALARMTEDEIKQSFPPLFTTLFKRMNELLIPL